MVGIALHNTKTAGDKKLLLPAKDDTIILINHEELIPDNGDISREGSSALYIFTIILIAVGCLTTSVWFSSRLVSGINHKWYCTCHVHDQSMHKDLNNRAFFHHDGLFAVHRENTLLASTTTRLNAIHHGRQQQIIAHPKETTEVSPISLTNAIVIIKNFEHNISIIRDYGLLKCFILSFELEHEPKVLNLYQRLIDALFGPMMFNDDIIPKTAKLQTPALTENELAQYGSEVINLCPQEIQTFRVISKTIEEITTPSVV